MSDRKSILITGDFCPVNRTSNLILGGRSDLLFNDFLPFIKNAGLAITNLECPLTDTGSMIKKTGPSLKAPVRTAKVLSDSGFNLVTLANNHIMDFGISGLRSTIEACQNNGIDYVGAGENFNKARRIYYTKVANHILAILNFTENEFSTTHDDNPGANPLDPIENFRDIIEAKRNANIVIVIVHGSHEMYDLPTPRIKKTFHFYADAGAGAIIGHHSHCYSGYEIYKGVPVFYGLGNFIFDKPGKRNSPWNYGFAVELFLEEKVKFNIIPYEQNNRNAGVKRMNDPEKKEFFINIEHLNNIIIDDELLDLEFEKYCNNVKKMYLSFLEPHSIRLFHFLRNRKLFPSLLSKRKKKLFLNLIRCESHRDVLIYLLDK